MPEEGMSLGDYIYRVYGRRIDPTDPNNPLSQAGRAVGISFNSNRKMVNTGDSHRLIELAKELNKQDEMVEAIFRAYFEDGVNISQKDNLIKIATPVLEGIQSGDQIKQFLDSDQYQDRVTSQLKDAVGIRGVPYFIVHFPNSKRKVPFSGAQPTESFCDLFEMICEHE